MSGEDSTNSGQSQASDDAWSYVIPNFKTLPAEMQSFIKATLPSLVQAAQNWVAQSGSSGENSQGKHNLGIVSPGMSYQATGYDHWLAVGGNYQEAMLGNRYGTTALTYSHTIGSALTEDQQSAYAASYRNIYGQSIEQQTSNKFEQIGGALNSLIGTNLSSSTSPPPAFAYSQGIMGSRYVFVQENDAVQASSLTEVYGNSNTNGTFVHSQTLYGGQNQAIGGEHYRSVSGVAYYTYGAAGPQPNPAPTPSPGTGSSSQSNTLAVLTPAAEEEAPTPTPTPEPSSMPIPESTTTETAYEATDVTWAFTVDGVFGAIPAMSELIAGSTVNPPPFCKFTQNQGSVSNQTFGETVNYYKYAVNSTYAAGGTSIYEGVASTIYLGLNSPVIVGMKAETVVGASMPMNTAVMSLDMIAQKSTLVDWTSHVTAIKTTGLYSITAGAAGVM